MRKQDTYLSIDHYFLSSYNIHIFMTGHYTLSFGKIHFPELKKYHTFSLLSHEKLSQDHMFSVISISPFQFHCPGSMLIKFLYANSL